MSKQWTLGDTIAHRESHSMALRFLKGLLQAVQLLFMCSNTIWLSLAVGLCMGTFEVIKILVASACTSWAIVVLSDEDPVIVSADEFAL